MPGGGVYVTLRDLIQIRYQAKGFSYLPAQPVHSLLAGRKRSRLRGRGLDFDELRHYRPGDDIRTMDWRVTRRARSPFVRVFTEERDRPVWVVVDQRLSMFFGSRYQMKSAAAARIAALTAWRVIGVGDRVGALLFNDDETSVFRPSRSPAGVMRCLEHLVSMNAALRATADSQSNPQALQRTLDLLVAARAIADADAPVLFHCHGGKDRTGLVAAFVLELLGVERELVLDDYVLTSELRVADADAFRDLMDDGLSAAAAAGVLGAPRELMVSILGRLDTEHGGAGGYLRDVGGLEDTVTNRLRDRLVKL